jgi:hypothetical protein
MPLTVTEILGRAQEGRTRPYICRCDDGEVYFVKGKSATRFGLISEWICARLCTALDLPIAQYGIANVPDELIAADLTGQYLELGEGPAFASCRVNATNLARGHIRSVPVPLRRDVILFDWWIHNADRTLTEMGGNPNLLWMPGSPGALKMIDHNLAFDSDFDAIDFLDLHVFAGEVRELFSDFLLRDSYAARFANALESWSDICDTLPDAWRFIDTEKTMPVEYPIEAVKTLLDRALTDSFWQLPPT